MPFWSDETGRDEARRPMEPKDGDCACPICKMPFGPGLVPRDVERNGRTRISVKDSSLLEGLAGSGSNGKSTKKQRWFTSIRPIEAFHPNVLHVHIDAVGESANLYCQLGSFRRRS